MEVVEAQGAAVGRELVELRHQIDLLELRFAALAAEFGGTDHYLDEGFISPIDWIRFNCHMSAPAAADRVCVGAHMAHMPATREAVESGGIGFAHLLVMARTADAVGDAFAETDLLDLARENSPGRLHHICRHYQHAKDPARFARDQAEAVEHRKLKLSMWPNGVLSIQGYLDAVGGAVLRSALEPLARKNGADDKRLRAQRLADALVELAAGKQKANLQVTSSLETLLGLCGSPAAETDFSLPISSKTVERLACDCAITRVLLDSDSLVIDVGRSKRVISGSRRRALNARDRGCRWPGCDRPAKWTEGHHIFHWIKGGGSEIENQVLLCYRHHWMAHEGGWQLVRAENGTILTIPPVTRFGGWARGPD